MKGVCVFVVLFSVSTLACGSQCLTINNYDVESITLKLGQTYTFEVVSDDTASYVDYIGFNNSAFCGDLTYLSATTEAGDLASVLPYDNPPSFCGYRVGAGGLPPNEPNPGAHFMFNYTPEETGQVVLKLYDSTMNFMEDSVSITIITSDMGTAFTYQGRLVDANSPANDFYDFQFKLYNLPDSPFDQVGNTVSREYTAVVDGYLTVQLDFGINVFDGQSRWLDISIRPGMSDDPNDYITLNPRQQIRPTPYALYAETAAKIDGTVSWNKVIDRPVGLDDGDDVGITNELDPEVGSNTANYVSKWNGTSLVSSSIYDDGNIGIGTISPTASLEVNGTLAAINDGVDSVLTVEAAGNGSHVRFIGEPTVGNPIKGDLWYTGSALNFYDGSNVIDLLSIYKWNSVSLSSDASKTISGLNAGGIYEFKVSLTQNTSKGFIRMRINEDGGNHYWRSIIGADNSGHGSDYHGGVTYWPFNDEDLSTQVDAGGNFCASFTIMPEATNDSTILITGTLSNRTDYSTANNQNVVIIGGRYEGDAGISSVTFWTSAGTMTGEILYKEISQ